MGGREREQHSSRAGAALVEPTKPLCFPARTHAPSAAPAGVLGEGASDKWDPALLRDEPLEKVQAVLREAAAIHEL